MCGGVGWGGGAGKRFALSSCLVHQILIVRFAGILI